MSVCIFGLLWLAQMSCTLAGVWYNVHFDSMPCVGMLEWCSMTFFWSCNGFQGLVYVVSLVLPMLIQNGLFVSAHPAPHSAFPSAYIRYTDIKGSYPKQRQLECKPSACQSNKQYLEHFVKRNRETGVSIIERDILDHHQGTFLQIETRKISYILSCVRGPTLATIHAVPVSYTHLTLPTILLV